MTTHHVQVHRSTDAASATLTQPRPPGVDHVSSQSTANRSRPRRRSSPLLDALDREWERLCRRPATMTAVRALPLSPELTMLASGARHVDQLVEAIQPRSCGREQADALLCELVELAASHELAGRIVLQRLLPGLISGARRWRSPLHEQAPADATVSAAWVAIRRYDTTKRRSFVAPALIADSLWIGLRRNARRRRYTELPMPADTLARRAGDPPELDALTALAGTMRAAERAGVSTHHLDVIRTLVAAGSPSQAARDCGVAPRTIRNRRDAAGAEIRDALGPDWADWRDPVIAAA